jgi:hypothetical protein
VSDPLPDSRAIQEALAAPFDHADVKFLPSVVKGNRCLAMAYVSARTVMDRLDDVLGAENWRDEYQVLPGGSVLCRLSCRVGGKWIAKADVGSPSEQPDEGDRLKAAFSDALKRAAVKWGVGRFLYRLPAVWCDYDPVKKQITQLPQMPAFGLPKSKAPAPAAKPAQPAPAAAQPNPAGQGGQHQQPPAQSPTQERRALRVRHFAACSTKADYDRLCGEVAADVKLGLLTEQDRQILLGVADQALARVKAARAGGAA